jgi:hypothetical protein
MTNGEIIDTAEVCSRCGHPTEQCICQITFLFAPDPDEKNPLLRAHNAEAERVGAEFGNYGKYTDDESICSKTTKGYLTSIMKGSEIHHVWEGY